MAINSISRRKCLQYSAATALGLWLPTQAQARIDIGSIMNLHPVRYVAGLIFSVASAVVKDFAEEKVVSLLKEGKPLPPYVRQTTCRVACDDMVFHHERYKVAMVELGVADHRVKHQQIELLLKDPLQKARFQDMVQYLRDEKLRIQLAGMEYPQVIGRDMTPDDFFMLDEHGITPHKAENLLALIELTGTQAFNDWSA